MLDFNDQNIMKGDFNRNYVSGEGQDFFDGFEISTALFFRENCHVFFFLQQATLTLVGAKYYIKSFLHLKLSTPRKRFGNFSLLGDAAPLSQVDRLYRLENRL